MNVDNEFVPGFSLQSDDFGGQWKQMYNMKVTYLGSE